MTKIGSIGYEFFCLDFPIDLGPTYYSSGQRRIIAILEAMTESDEGTVFLIDEPELSLHIDWQRDFINKISSLIPSKKILATHSPDILYHHHDKVVEVPPRSEV